MSGKAAISAPTQPRPTDGQGHDLDEWGLPLSGPARRRRLAELGKPDPNIDPTGWAAGAKPAAKPRAPRKPAIGGKQGKVVIDEAAGLSDVRGAILGVSATVMTENGNG